MHLLAGSRMDETDGLCLEIETVCLCAIEFIALDGTAKTVGMGTVHPELVRTAGVGPEGEEREIAVGAEERGRGGTRRL